MKRFLLSAGLSLLALLGSVVVPPFLSISGQFSYKGFPANFYLPGTSDTMPNFHFTAFFVDFVIYVIVIYVVLLLVSRLRKLGK